MNKKFRKLILPVSLLVASQSNALGLGSLQVNSSLDEVLNGEIPFVIDSSEEVESIEVSVASYSEYEKVGLDKSYVPSNISVSMVEKNGQKYVELSSKGPVSEPIVSLLLVVDWSNGHLLREYTILLDPPMFQNNQATDYSKTVQTSTYEAPKQIESKTQPVSQISSQSNNSYTGSSQVVVESGDTLWRIASRYNDGNTPQQMMVAIFNNNPGAFQNNDMNRLRKGAVLTIPDSNQVSMVSNGKALSEVRSHTQSWSSSQSVDSSNANDSSSVDYGIELIPPSDSDSSNTNNSSGSSSSARINTQTIADLNKAKEQLASSSLENSELSSRISELEKIVEDQELALSLKDTNLAQLQDQLSSDATTTLDNSVDTLVEDTYPTVEETSTDDVWDDDQPITDANDTTAEVMDSTDLVDDIGTREAVDDVETDHLLAEDTQINDTDTTSVDDTIIEEVQQPVITPLPSKQVSWIDQLMEYKVWLMGLGALLIGLLGFVFMKRRGEDSADSDSGGFLDSIESDEFNSPLDSSATELDLSNIDDLEDLDGLNELEVDDELESGDEPEVIVMDDIDESSETSFDDLDELDVDLDIENIAEEQITEFSESTDLDLSELDLDLDGDLESEELSLDFDLDDLDIDDKDSSEEELEFDLDMDEDLTTVKDDIDELENLDFDDDKETAEIVEAEQDSEENSEEESGELEFDLSDDLFDTDDLELDLDDEAEVEMELDIDSDDSEIELELDIDEDSELEFDLDEVDLEFDTSEDELEVSLDDDKTELNLTALDESELSLDLDLESEDEVESEVEPIEFASDEDVDIGLDLDDLAGDDAIDTKLDLAKAYFEMGDIDGAKQMVEEIIEEGNDEQQSMAEILKSEIEDS